MCFQLFFFRIRPFFPRRIDITIKIGEGVNKPTVHDTRGRVHEELRWWGEGKGKGNGI